MVVEEDHPVAAVALAGALLHHQKAVVIVIPVLAIAAMFMGAIILVRMLTLRVPVIRVAIHTVQLQAEVIHQ